MTETRKYIIGRLLEGWYMKKWKSHYGNSCYRLYDPGGFPQQNIRVRTIEKLDDKLSVPQKKKLWKIEKKTGSITLNLAVVRQLDGRSYIKKQYRKLKKVS